MRTVAKTYGRTTGPRGAAVKPQRVCAQCGAVEPSRWVLTVLPGRMFKVWKGASHDVDLCSFECSAKWYAPKEPTRCDRYRDLLEAWAQWWDGPGRERFTGYGRPPLSDTASALACMLCAGIEDGGRCAACGRQMGGW